MSSGRAGYGQNQPVDAFQHGGQFVVHHKDVDRAYSELPSMRIFIELNKSVLDSIQVRKFRSDAYVELPTSLLLLDGQQGRRVRESRRAARHGDPDDQRTSARA